MSNNEQVCKHHRVFEDRPDLPTSVCDVISRQVICSGNGPCKLFEPREKRKVKKEVKAWAVAGTGGVVCSLHYSKTPLVDNLMPGYTIVELTGTYDVEE